MSARSQMSAFTGAQNSSVTKAPTATPAFGVSAPTEDSMRAAAPAMYEVLRKMYWQDGKLTTDDYHELCAALRKAELA